MAQERLHRLDGRTGIERPEKSMMLVDGGRSDEALLVSGSALAKVDRGVDSLVGHLTIQHDLRVARALELLEDDLVHPASGFDECRRDDGQRPTALDVAG